MRFTINWANHPASVCIDSSIHYVLHPPKVSSLHYCDELFLSDMTPSLAAAMDSVRKTHSFFPATRHDKRLDRFYSRLRRNNFRSIMGGGKPTNSKPGSDESDGKRYQLNSCFDYFYSIMHPQIKSNIISVKVCKFIFRLNNRLIIHL